LHHGSLTVTLGTIQQLPNHVEAASSHLSSRLSDVEAASSRLSSQKAPGWRFYNRRILFHLLLNRLLVPKLELGNQG
jgi:hypothetical protein